MNRLIIIILAVCAFAEDSAATKPNVLFIAVDDLRVELGCYGSAHVRSPNIDRLAERGTLFEHAYCQQTVCNPSRASALTGLRPDTLRVWDLVTHFRVNEPDALTLSQLFKRGGYHARCIGKIFHNWRQDEWKGDERSWSVPSILHYNSHGNDKAQVAGELPPNLASGKGGTECRDVPDTAYFDGRVAEAAVEALKAAQQSAKPFFLAVGFWKPHTPFNAPKKYWDLYDPAAIPLPDHLQAPVDVPDIALTSARFDPSQKAVLREMHHGHLAAIAYLDTQVGKVLEELDRLGLRDNTIVVFWSDHGLHLGEHGLTRKTTAFELDARVPLIIDAPGFEDGQRSEALVELLDLYPTLADLCELKPPATIEGKSLTPLLADPAAAIKQGALTQTPRPNYPRGKMPEMMGYSLRTKRFRYTEWRDFTSNEIRARELYDHHSDDRETVNVAGAEIHRADVQRLAAQLQATLDPGGLPPVAQPGEGALESAEFIFELDERPSPQCHSSTIVELADGELAAAWFGGTTEPDIDNVIWFSRRSDSGWSKPRMVADGTEGEDRDHRVGNPVLFQPDKGPLMLFYKVVDREIGRASSWWGMLTTSSDNGETWTRPRRLGRDPRLGDGNDNLIGPVKNKPIQLSDGSILCPSSTEHHGWRVHFEVTRDFGTTWEVIGPIHDASQINAIQPSILTYKDGRMQVLCRSKEGSVAQSWSEDGGKTWGPVTATDLPNPNSGTDAVTLADGRQLIVYNHTLRKGSFPSGRNMLNVALSNEGRTWRPVMTLERDRGEFSYPAVIQTRDGKIHITYTWKRETIRHVALSAEHLP